MDDLVEMEMYLVGIKNGRMRIAMFNGFETDKGWDGMDWSGDTGHSSDSWMHEQVEWYLPIRKLAINVNEYKQVTQIFINKLG